MLCSYFPIKVGVGPSSALALGAILVQFFSVLSHNKTPKSELVSIFQSEFFFSKLFFFVMPRSLTTQLISHDVSVHLTAAAITSTVYDGAAATAPTTALVAHKQYRASTCCIYIKP